jgi:hypothetical protein
MSDRDVDDVAVALVASLLPDGDHASGLCCSHSEGAQDADVDPRVPAPCVVAVG